MKKIASLVVAALLALSANAADSWIRVNQLGYQPDAVKVAVFISLGTSQEGEFTVSRSIDGVTVYRAKAEFCDGSNWGMKSAARLDFSSLTEPGGYYITFGKTRSDAFRIDPGIYDGTADYLLKYVRAQRCGYNPYLADSCHTHDGVIVDHPTLSGMPIDVVGGYHDATDYLRYTATTSTSVYQMMFAYMKSPSVYGDGFDASGKPGANGIPDIVDEIRWGLDWLLKMNPDSGMMFNQVADDRDHQGFRLPTTDKADYGLGLSRPVYFVTGKPQGLAAFKNRTEGVASTAGKFASVFAMGAKFFRDSDPAYASLMAAKAEDAFEFALTDPGATQTACVVSPYFYEEDNYADDMELAAWELYSLTGNGKYLEQADYWGTLEPYTPWIISDTARHYQYYPFVNLGHANLASSAEPVSQKYAEFMRKGLGIISRRDADDAFRIGIPFVWCSNNYVSAVLTQCRLYHEATGDTRYMYMEAALRDWLFGCNPWGTSMICGIPAGGDYPVLPHSSYTRLLGEPTFGGLIDGPVYKRIYENLKGLSLMNPDPYAAFQGGNVVYHDDMGDYSTNEPTLDGTASLSYYLSTLEKNGHDSAGRGNFVTDANGAVVRIDTSSRNIYLMFSADEFGEGFDHILRTLDEKKIKASFFLTGNFLRNESYKKTVKRIIDNGHYVGPHSDGHLLYADWSKRDSLLVTRQQFMDDMKRNLAEMKKAGVRYGSTVWFLAPYEWYNEAIARWSAEAGLKLVNLTPGSVTAADYTTPDMPSYRSSQQLYDGLMTFEQKTGAGLSGALLLIHPGTDPRRTDKFYMKLADIIDQLEKKGYTFKRL